MLGKKMCVDHPSRLRPVRCRGDTLLIRIPVPYVEGTTPARHVPGPKSIPRFRHVAMATDRPGC